MKLHRFYFPLLAALSVAGLAAAGFAQPAVPQPIADREGDDSRAIQLLEARVRVERTRAAVVRAETQLETAKKRLDEYQKGAYEIQKAGLFLELASAEEASRLAQDRLSKLKEAAKKKDEKASPEIIEKAQFACLQAVSAKRRAELKLGVLNEYTKPMELCQLQGAIHVGKADLEAAQAESMLATTRLELLKSALAAARLDRLKSTPEPRAASNAGDSARTAPKSAQPTAEKPQQAIRPAPTTVNFEELKTRGGPFQRIYRARVPGGWLVGFFSNHGEEGLIFYPDPVHKWQDAGIR